MRAVTGGGRGRGRRSLYVHGEKCCTVKINYARDGLFSKLKYIKVIIIILR